MGKLHPSHLGLVMDLVCEGLKGLCHLIYSHPAALKRVTVKKVGLSFIHQGKRPTHIRVQRDYKRMKEFMIGHPVQRP